MNEATKRTQGRIMYPLECEKIECKYNDKATITYTYLENIEQIKCEICGGKKTKSEVFEPYYHH